MLCDWPWWVCEWGHPELGDLGQRAHPLSAGLSFAKWKITRAPSNLNHSPHFPHDLKNKLLFLRESGGREEKEKQEK